MWKEFLGGAGILTVLLILIGTINSRLGGKMNTDVCKQIRQNMFDNFENIKSQQLVNQKQFEDMNKKLDKQQETLIEVKTMLTVVARNTNQ